MKEAYNIAGIQQVGLGVKDLEKAKRFYAQYLGMDLPVFEDEAEAKLMQEYTDGKMERRKAALLMNLKGGGGFELWQFVNRKARKASFEVKEGQLGISTVHLRTSDIHAAYSSLKELENCEVSEIKNDGLNRSYFLFKDTFDNGFKIIQDNYRFLKTNHPIGGVIGVTIGVSNPVESVRFYREIVGFSKIVGEQEIEGKRYWWLKQGVVKKSAFGDLLGPIMIEIVYDPNESETRIYKERCWGDLGFIHLCLDVQNMGVLKQKAEQLGSYFSVDSNDEYDMGEAAGRFAYVEDPDGTLIELVETYKVPILRKLKWSIRLSEKKKFKALPKWLFRVLALNRVKP